MFCPSFFPARKLRIVSARLMLPAVLPLGFPDWPFWNGLPLILPLLLSLIPRCSAAVFSLLIGSKIFYHHLEIVKPRY